jgi:hypothetical protein
LGFRLVTSLQLTLQIASPEDFRQDLTFEPLPQNLRFASEVWLIPEGTDLIKTALSMPAARRSSGENNH